MEEKVQIGLQLIAAFGDDDTTKPQQDAIAWLEAHGVKVAFVSDEDLMIAIAKECLA